MAKVEVPYLIERPGRAGLPRYFWQPSSKLRQAGWRPQRVPANWQQIADPAQLRGAAIAEAQAINLQLETSRAAAPATAAAAPAPRREDRSVGALITRYEASADFRKLKEKTQKQYRWCLRILRDWGGDVAVAAVTTKQVRAFYEQLREAHPAKAIAVARLAGILFAYGRRQDWRRDNPAAELDLDGLPPSGLIWPKEAIAAIVAAADRMGRHSIGTAVLLNEWLGQREADLLKLPRNALAPRGSHVAQGKTGAHVLLPVAMVPSLVARVEAELARQAARRLAKGLEGGPVPTTLIVNEETGRPYDPDHFRHVFLEIRRTAAAGDERRGIPPTPVFAADYIVRKGKGAGGTEVALEDLWFMYLRHTAVTRLAEAECTDLQIASITGHDPKTVAQILKRYLVRTAKLARGAFQKRLDAEALGGEG